MGHLCSSKRGGLREVKVEVCWLDLGSDRIGVASARCLLRIKLLKLSPVLYPNLVDLAGVESHHWDGHSTAGIEERRMSRLSQTFPKRSPTNQLSFETHP